MSEVKKIELLIDALSGFQTGLLENAAWAMGISAVAAGWLITSDKARDFFRRHHKVAYVFAISIVLSTIGYSFLTLEIQQTSQTIFCRLAEFKDAEGLFEHYRISVMFAVAYIAFQSAVSLALAIMLVLIARESDAT